MRGQKLTVPELNQLISPPSIIKYQRKPHAVYNYGGLYFLFVVTQMSTSFPQCNAVQCLENELMVVGSNPSIEILLGNITPNLIIISLIILYISFSAGKVLIDTKYPFRGYIISAAILFVISWMRSGGATGGEDSHGESFTYLDPKRAKEFAETGLIFTQYWLYVSASYLGLFFGFMKRRNK